MYRGILEKKYEGIFGSKIKHCTGYVIGIKWLMKLSLVGDIDKSIGEHKHRLVGT